MKYKSLEELDRDFQRQVDAASDDDRPGVQSQWQSAKFEFREAQLVARERQAWVRDALAEYPGAREFQDMVAGDTEEAVKASARGLHERVQRLTAGAGQPSGQQSQDDLRQQAQAAYGRAGVGGGEAYQPPDGFWDERQTYADKYNGSRRGQFGEVLDVQPGDTDRYVAARGGRHLFEAIRRNAALKYGDASPYRDAAPYGQPPR